MSEVRGRVVTMANGRPGSDTAARCSPIGGPDLAILGFLLYNPCYFVFLIVATPVYS